MFLSRKIIGTAVPMLGLPSNHADFTWAWSKVVEFNCHYLCGPDQRVHYDQPDNSVHDIARNQIAGRSLGEWTYFQDVDHAPEPDILFRLVDAMHRYGADIVTALYLQRKPPYWPNIWKFHEDGTHSHFAEWPRGEVLEVDCAGGGSLLVRNTVFTRIWNELGEDPFSRLEFERGKNMPTGEDFAFFRRCHRLGIKTICPTSIECPHIEHRHLRMWKDYDPARESQPLRMAGARGVQPLEAT